MVIFQSYVGGVKMFSAFNLNLKDAPWADRQYELAGVKLQMETAPAFFASLEKYVLDNGDLSGTMMETDWFPSINADIFISHSHKDEVSVIQFAGWLKEKFNLVAFIDSLAWGYSNDLLQKIDKKYCKTSDGFYSYNKRNYSTSHVHMMLSIALLKMIDKCESVFFFNTPNSIVLSETIKDEEFTLSPWIYAELEMQRLIQHKSLLQYRNAAEMLFDTLQHSLQAQERAFDIRYKVSTKSLIDISDSEIAEWASAPKKKTRTSNPLDNLYILKGLLKASILQD